MGGQIEGMYQLWIFLLILQELPIMSVDTSSLWKDKKTLLEMFDEVVKEVGQENIVQFVSDNESAFKAAGKALQ